MTSTPPLSCGPCKYEGITKDAEKWCTFCDEGFCSDCEKTHRSLKLTRNHKMIDTKDYMKIQDLSVNLKCETHGQKLDLYCKCHHVAECAMCIPSEHNSCPVDDIISIHDAAINAKSSTALSDLEETISRSLESVRQCIRDRASVSANIDTEEQTIQKKILETRLRLNKHLDELEQQLLQELQIKHENCRSRYSKMLKQLQQTENELEKLKEQTEQMKLFASDLQVFLGTSSEDKIYYTDENNDTVNCCGFKGKKIWTFKNEYTRCPRGITVNNDQNLYVVSSNSNNLTLIQNDGKMSIEVLTSSDDLFSPFAVCCNKNSLLLGYKKGNTALYHVSE
ncbi:E3 ubiquitin-protein ligase TRIM45-like [Mytilus edulis]|uniref:E3 ubiquitin-protein ligase TRIM45-like n=1 Tax=Mytilus edulis TaxID=6550 RepID=UPI0039F05C45